MVHDANSHKEEIFALSSNLSAFPKLATTEAPQQATLVPPAMPPTAALRPAQCSSSYRKHDIVYSNVSWIKESSTGAAVTAKTSNTVSAEPSVTRASASTTTLRPKALYMFAGPKRRGDVSQFLRAWRWEIIELDILLHASHDLSARKNQETWRRRTENNEFTAIVISPPCDTFTRVMFSNTNGPAPLRCFDEPRGYSWLMGARLQKAKLGNILTDFTMEILLIQLNKAPGLIFVEFPEDLGSIRNGPNKGVRPASIWQWPPMSKIRSLPGVTEAGILQSDFEAGYLKPTRVMFKGQLAPATFYPGPPTFDAEGNYLGPIPHKNAQSLGLITLARQKSDSTFRTTGTAAWPPKLCKWAADSLHLAYTNFLAEELKQPMVPSTASDIVGGDTTAVYKDTTTDLNRSTTFETVVPQFEFWNGGVGPPRQTYMLGKSKAFNDGAGLTSPGRWPAKSRVYPPGRRWDLLRTDLLQLLLDFEPTRDKPLGRDGIQRLLLQLAVTPKQDIFPEALLLKGRNLFKSWICSQCSDFNAEEEDFAPGQPFALGIISALLREMGDPDFALFTQLKTGVSPGIASPLPHNPVMFELQTSWRLPELFSDCTEAENYASVEEHKLKVKALFEEEREQGMMNCLPKEVFFERFKGRSTVSSMAAILERGGTKLRVLHDGTHTVGLNNRIRCRDKLRSPGVAEKFSQFRERRKKGQIVISLLMDVTKAHRRVKIVEAEQGYLGCKLEEHEVWFNLVGTFGIASAAYWWARLFGGLVRLLHGLLGPRWVLELLAYADDLEATAGNENEREGIVMIVFVLSILGCPLKPSKFRGGFQVEWIGLAIDNRLYALGLSLSRAQWCINWSKEVINSKTVETSNFAGGLGRLNFAAQALLYERPWLGPLYSWSSTTQLSGLRSACVPWGIKFFLYAISKRLAEGERLMITPSLPADHGFLFKSDAKAEGGRATIGGWECRGGCPASKARWFMVELFPSTSPWVFMKANDPGRVVATLELLGTLLCLAVFDFENNGDYKGIHTISGTTDNMGNSLAMVKCMSTKWPLAPCMMELTEQLRKRQLELHLVWERRDKNIEADALTNEEFGAFDSEKRIQIDFPSFPWLVLDQALVWAKEVYDISELAKTRRRESMFVDAGIWKRRKTAAADRLKSKDPW